MKTFEKKFKTRDKKENYITEPLVIDLYQFFGRVRRQATSEKGNIWQKKINSSWAKRQSQFWFATPKRWRLASKLQAEEIEAGVKW